MSIPQLGPCPPRFTELKAQIASSYPNFEHRITQAWHEVLGELATATADIISKGPDVRTV